ncbi:MAG: PIG-L family deacetylase, partial [Clostridia bacterium]|nr:PIG-L family deacetylase [Clostridia bacterium]
MIKKFLLPLAFCIMLTLAAFANEARDITAGVDITFENIKGNALTDGKIKTASSGENIKIAISSNEKMGGAWVRYTEVPTGAKLDTRALADNGFFSDYIDFGGKTEVLLEYGAASICDFKVYSEGRLPSEVQLWEKSEGETDIMLFASHSDDDQLFFAGLVPYYMARGNVDFKVCFFTTSYQDISRVQELLAGLWHCGLKNYPIIFPLPDDYSESYDGALKNLVRQGYSEAQVKDMVRGVLDTYCPSVVVLHDFKGEYSHGMHIFATKVITDVIAEG